MRIELTDAMIAKELAATGMFTTALGALCILGAVVIFIISRKKPQILGNCMKLCVVLLIAGLLVMAKGITTGRGAKEFQVVKSQVTNKYDRKNSSKGRRKYWVECYGVYKFKVSRSDYYDKYEIGDTVYVVVEADDKDDVLCSYHGEEYKYVGKD